MYIWGWATRVHSGSDVWTHIRMKWVLFFSFMHANGMGGHISIPNWCHIGLVFQYGYLLPSFPPS